jgi:hypothetical protein
MAIIPVVLEFSSIAQNYNLCATLTTPGALWSMGDGGEDSVGISYNALTLDSQHSCFIQRIEFTGSTLAICTGPAAGSDFTLTAFIDIPDGVRWLQGTCILNEKARVLARLGDLPTVEWRGEVNCAVPLLLPDIHRATLSVKGIKQGQVIRVTLADDESEHGGFRWCIAPIDDADVGLVVRSARGNFSLPLAMFRVDDKNVELVVAGVQKAGATADLDVEVYIERFGGCRYCPPLQHVLMKTECDGGVEIVARVGTRRPQYLAQTYKRFRL